MSETTPNTNRRNKKAKKKQRSYKGLFATLWGLFIVGVLAFGFLLFAISNAWFGFDPLPTGEELENPKNSLASEIYAADGVLLGKFYVQDRSNVEYKDLPEHLVNALIATEDSRFYEHSGIDFYGLTTAIYRTINGSPSGASTISQQLAKNLLHERESGTVKRILQKMQEWIIAIRLERQYTKKEILTMYFNTVHLGYDLFGIKSSAKAFFNKETEDLSVEEGAVLVGMLKASTRFNPKRNPNNSKKRRNVVLSQMVRYNYLAPSQYEQIKGKDIELDYHKLDHNEGLATYFREHLRQVIKEWSSGQKKVNGEKYDIYRDGLKIYTTIDSKMQQYAEEAVQTHMAVLQEDFEEEWGSKNPWEDRDFGDDDFMDRAMRKSDRYRDLKKAKKSKKEIEKSFNTPTEMSIFSWQGDIDTILTPLDSIKHYKRILHTGLMAMNPQNGYVTAWVGGIDHRHFKFDNITSTKQVGSTFKPFVYTLAVQNGWSPCHKLLNTQVTFEKGKYGIPKKWEPRGSTSKDGQMLTLQQALANSLNWITGKLMFEFGPNPVVDLAKNMGIESHIDAVPAICLGVPEITPFEMVGAYNTFVNRGIWTKPLFITRIEDKNGQIIQSFAPEEKEVLNEQTAYVMLRLMEGVARYGTGRRLKTKYKMYDSHIAGKTGTTNQNSDGWFIGMVPQLVAGVWTGGDEKVIRFKSTAKGQGANMALPIWAEFMQRVYADESLGISKTADFKRPRRVEIETDCYKYETPSDAFPTDVLKEDRYGDEFN